MRRRSTRSAMSTAGWFLRDQGERLLWFKIIALLIPPLTGVVVIARRRHVWTGCHWLFWATIALGLTMSAIGLVGWTVDEFMLGRETSWLGWYTVFALFGAVAPLLGLLAQPHRGSREAVTATTAVDIAGIAVMAGFLYSRFVIGPDLTPMSGQRASLPLLLLSEFQQLIIVAGMVAAAFVARDLRWGATYRRLAHGTVRQRRDPDHRESGASGRACTVRGSCTTSSGSCRMRSIRGPHPRRRPPPTPARRPNSTR